MVSLQGASTSAEWVELKRGDCSPRDLNVGCDQQSARGGTARAVGSPIPRSVRVLDILWDLMFALVGFGLALAQRSLSISFSLLFGMETFVPLYLEIRNLLLILTDPSLESLP